MSRTMRRLGALAATLALLTVTHVVANAQARPWLGVVTQSVDADLRESLDLKDDGVLVNRVVPDSPADRAGLRTGDVIVRFDGRDVTSPDQLADLVSSQRVGETVSLVVIRDGSRREYSAELAERGETTFDRRAPEPPSAPEAPTPPSAPRAPRAPRAPVGDDDVHIRAYRNGKPVPDDEARKMLEHLGDLGDLGDLRLHIDGDADDDGGKSPKIMIKRFGDGGSDMPEWRGLAQLGDVGSRGRLGVRIETLSPDLASAVGSPGSRGVFVLEVLEGTPAQKAGLKAGDVIREVNGKPVYDSGDLRTALPKDGGRVSLTVVRRGSERTIEAVVDAAPRTMEWRDSGPMGLGRGGDDRIKVFRQRLTPEAGGNESELRNELRELREQLRDLRNQLEDLKR